MIDAKYRTMYRQAAKLQHNFHDSTYQSAHDPAATMMRRELHGLTNDIAQGRNPKTLEARLNRIQSKIQQSQRPGYGASRASMYRAGAAPIMDRKQTMGMNRSFSTMRRSIQQHPHY